MTKYKDQYRIETTRLPTWDYAGPGIYAVTICTRNSIPFFGTITQGEVKLSRLGNMAHQYWEEIPKHFHHIQLDAYVIMPNHIHGIIINTGKRVETQHAASLPGRPEEWIKKGSLGVIVRSYKSAVSRAAHRAGLQQFAWQPRYCDHIVENQHGLDAMRGYIQSNPMNWTGGKER